MAANRQVVHLDQLYEFASGLSKPRSAFGEGFPFLSFRDVFHNTFIPRNLSELVKSSETERRNLSIERGDVFLTRTSETVDELGMSCVALADVPNATFNGFTKRLRPKSQDAIVPEYAGYFFRGPSFRSGVYAMSSLSTRASLNNEMLARLTIMLPSVDEQAAIGQVLKALDDKIELNRRMNETLEEMARALFKSWFVDFDPVRAKLDGRDVSLPSTVDAVFPKSFRQSEFGKLPDGWRLSSLGDEARRCGGVIQTGPFGSQLHASDYVECGVPVIMPQDLSRRRVLTAKIARVEEGDAERLGRHRVRRGDVVYSRRGDVERHALIGERETGWLCGTGCLLVRLGKKFPSPLFASLSLDLAETRAWIVQHAIGATMPNLNTGILSRVPFLVPDDALLHAFENILQPLAKRIVENDRNAEVLSNVRDALLPKLLSGELRLKAAEKMVEAVA